MKFVRSTVTVLFVLLLACEAKGGHVTLDATLFDAPPSDAADAAADASLAHDAALDAPVDSAFSDAADAASSTRVPVQILAMNDFHGAIEASPSSTVVTAFRAAPEVNETVPAGGAAFLATHLRQQRAETTDTFFVHAGDLIGATPLTSALFHDEPTIEVMNALALDLSSVGNHEFDEGTTELLRMRFGGCHAVDGCFAPGGAGFGGANFTYLAANVETAAMRTLFPRFEIRHAGGIPVAFIGMTLEGTANVVLPSGVAGLRFLDEVETVNTLVPQLNAQGIHAIVVVVHQGGFQGTTSALVDGCEGGLLGDITGIANELDGDIDIVISGHTHAAYNCVVGGKIVTSALSNGRVFTDIDAQLDSLSHDFVNITAVNRIVTRDVTPDPTVAALVAEYSAAAVPVGSRVVGHASTRLGADLAATSTAGETAMGAVIADAQLEATREAGAVIAFQNAGGVRASIDEGEITYSEMYTVQPFSNYLVTMTLTGSQIEELLESQFRGTARRIMAVSSGFSYTWNDLPSANDGDRIDPQSIRLNGIVLDAEATYRITVNNFMAGGGDGFAVLAQGRDVVGGVSDLDALEAYLRTHSPLSAPILDRVARLVASSIRRQKRIEAEPHTEACGQHW